jgi:hypothetical protein
LPDFNGLAPMSFKVRRSFTSLKRAYPPPRIRGLTEFSVSFITFHVSSSSAIAPSISPFGPSIKQSTDVCRAAIIFLIIIFPVRLVQSHYYQSYGFNYGDSQESFVKEQLKFLRVVEQMTSSFENSAWIPIFRDSTCYFTGVGDPEECAKADGISYYNSGTGELRKPLQYRNGVFA